jgi:single-stranded DNA-binding protein
VIHNKIYFGGYVGRDAEEFKTQSGVRIVSFSLCYTKKGKDGRPDVPTWTRIKVFGNWCDYALGFKKGDNVFVEGELQVATYKDKTGAEKTSVDIVPFSLALVAKPLEKSQALPNAVGYPAQLNDDIPF